MWMERFQTDAASICKTACQYSLLGEAALNVILCICLGRIRCSLCSLCRRCRRLQSLCLGVWASCSQWDTGCWNIFPPKVPDRVQQFNVNLARTNWPCTFDELPFFLMLLSMASRAALVGASVVRELLRKKLDMSKSWWLRNSALVRKLKVRLFLPRFHLARPGTSDQFWYWFAMARRSIEPTLCINIAILV